MLHEVPQRVKITAGGSGIHSYPPFAPAIDYVFYGTIIIPANDLASKVFPPIKFDNPGKGTCSVTVSNLYIDKRIGIGDINLALTDHFHVFVKGIGKYLFYVKTGFSAEKLHQ
jgi:hypothetical protein